MKGGWRTAPLDSVADFINGLWKGEKPPFVHVGVIRNTNFTKEGALDHTDIAYLDVEAKKYQTRRLQFGDLILEKSGGGPKQPVGRVVFFDRENGDFSFSNFTAAIRVVDKDEIDPRFLHKYLYWVYLSGRTESMQSHSTGIRNLNADAYKATEVHYPSIVEQRRIVAILDKSFEGIATAKASAEKNLQNARELFESRREEVFFRPGTDWMNRPLSDVCDIKHGYAFEGEFFAASGDHVLLTPGSFFEAGGYRDRGEKQKYFIGPIPGGYILEKDDLLLAMTEQAAGLLGSPLLVPESGRFLHNQRLGLVVPKQDVAWSNEFFFHVFNLKRVRDEIHASASGVKVRHTSPSKIGAVRVSFPKDIKMQAQIASSLFEIAEECAQLLAVSKRKLAALEELKKSLLHQAFTGQL